MATAESLLSGLSAQIASANAVALPDNLVWHRLIVELERVDNAVNGLPLNDTSVVSTTSCVVPQCGWFASMLGEYAGRWRRRGIVIG